MAYAKYTFFEAATQHGYVVALMGPRMAKSRESFQIIIDPHRGRVFQLFKTTDPAAPVFEFVIPERETTESTMMWRDKAKRALEGEWKRYQKAKQEAKAGLRGSGEATTVPSESPPSPPTASSTDAPQRLASLIGPYGVAEPAAPVSDPAPSTPVSSPTTPTSSKGSGPQSRKSGSKSRSSSGASTANSG